MAVGGAIRAFRRGGLRGGKRCLTGETIARFAADPGTLPGSRATSVAATAADEASVQGVIALGSEKIVCYVRTSDLERITGLSRDRVLRLVREGKVPRDPEGLLLWLERRRGVLGGVCRLVELFGKEE